MLGRMVRHGTPSLPDGFTLRRPRPGDEHLVLALRRAVETAQWGEPGTTLAEVLEEWALPRLDLEHDVWLVDGEGVELAGYAGVWLESPPGGASAELVVHPACRGLGLSAALLDLCEGRAAELAAGLDDGLSLLVVSPSRDEALQALYQSRGYGLDRVFYRVEASLAEPPAPPRVPKGIAVHLFRRHRDERLVHAASEEAFRDHYRPAGMSFEEWEPFRFSRPDLDLGLWHVAWDGDEVAGTVVSFLLPDGGYVDELSVRRPWRGRGLGRALLLTTFAALRARGARRVYLGVDAQNPTGAFGLYESVGMRPSRENRVFERRIRSRP